MEDYLRTLVRQFRPALDTLSRPERGVRLPAIPTLVYAVPLALLGLHMLLAATDLRLMRAVWPTLLLLFILGLLFERLGFFRITEIQPRRFLDRGTSLDTLVVWSAALIFGPLALWLDVLWQVIRFARGWRQLRAPEGPWSHLGTFAWEITGATLPSLGALAFYADWGGSIPLPGLTLAAVLPAVAATFVRAALYTVGFVPFLLSLGRSPAWISAERSTWLRLFTRYILFWYALAAVIDPFAILAAGLYTQHGLGAYLFLMAGLLLGSFLAQQLSTSAARNWARSRELERLEQLAHALLHAPPDASTLPTVLREHVPAMFPASQIEIRLFPDRVLLHEPPEWPPVAEPIWEWLRTTAKPHCCALGAPLPWDPRPAATVLVLAPITDVERRAPIGGIYVAGHPLAFWDPRTAAHMLPAVQSLAAQIASVLHGAEVYAATLAHQRVAQELTWAWQIQASLLPDVLPNIAGWDLAAALDPAREVSGDFYDCIPLPGGCWGLLVADVADKGLGPALYMALARTLIRTYAVEHARRPDLALSAANRRLLADTHISMFVTVFYGILDPRAGTLTYCNAGHNPPYLLSAATPDALQGLSRTGIPLGIADHLPWQQQTVQLVSGDVVVLYSDGVTEAQDRHGVLFDTERLLEVVRAHRHCSAGELQDAILAKVRAFVGDAPQFDDITLMVVRRE